MARFATLDIGTNTVLLLVAEPMGDGDRFRPLLERAEITRLGRGAERTGRLDRSAIERTVSVVARFVSEARALGAQAVACAATAACREAANSQEFLDRVRLEAGVQVEIIDGDLEAELSYLSAQRELGDQTPLVVLDIGGGSTEVVFGDRGGMRFRTSLAIGSVRLTERFAHHDPPSESERAQMTALIEQTLASLPAAPRGFQLVGIAGTVTTVAAVSRGVEPYQAERVHLSRLSRAEVEAELERYFRLDLRARRALRGMHPMRADVIPAGALILERAMARLNAHEVVVSDRGIRWGLLYRRFGGAPTPD